MPRKAVATQRRGNALAAVRMLREVGARAKQLERLQMAVAEAAIAYVNAPAETCKLRYDLLARAVSNLRQWEAKAPQ